MVITRVEVSSEIIVTDYDDLAISVKLKIKWNLLLADWTGLRQFEDGRFMWCENRCKRFFASREERLV